MRGDEPGAVFGLDPAGAEARLRLGRRQAAIGVLAALALVGTVAGFALTGAPAVARRPQLFGGTIVLDDTRGPVVLDLATGEPTLRLQGVAGDVGASGPSQVAATAVQGGTLLLDDATGSFNFLDESSLVTKPTGGGVSLPRAPGTLRATAFPDGSAAYVVRYRRGGTDVALVDEATVARAATAAAAARSALAGRRGDAALRHLVRAATVTVPLPGEARLSARLPARPGATVSAGGSLWSLARTRRGTELLELSPGAGSALNVRARGGASARGALAAAVAPGGTVVGLGEPGSLELFVPGRAGLQVRHVALPATAFARAIVPVGGAASSSTTLWYVFQGGGPDRLVGVGAASGRVLVDRPLAGMPPGRVVAPVLDGGRIYALVDDGTRQPPLVVVDPRHARARPLEGAPRYPLFSATESPTFASPEILDEGPRVVINNPDSLLAVVVFTGSGRAHVVDKRLAALVDPSAPPAALQIRRPAVRRPPRAAHPHRAPRPGARRPTPTTTTTPPAPAPNPPVVPTHVDVQLSCADTNQKPRAPELLPAAPGTTSVALSWSYQLLTSEDCAPTSYVVHVAPEPGTTPPARASWVVQGATSLQVTGLRPSSSYQIVVTAYIGHQSTASAPEVVSTEAAGPDAPLDLAVGADGSSGWSLTWRTCAGRACISPDPVVAFAIRAQGCAGTYVGAPPTLTIPAGADAATYPFRLDPSLVGQALRFSVQAIGADGLVSNLATGGGCVVGWRPASPSLVRLDAGGRVASNGTVTATLSLALAAPADQALGSVAPELVYHVGGQTVGPTTADQVSVPGLPAGVAAATSVTVLPAGHPEAAVTLDGPPLAVTAPWPPLTLSASASALPADPNLGRIHLAVAHAFTGLPQGAPLVASGQLVCGSAATTFAQAPVAHDPRGTGGTATFGPIDLTANGGACTLEDLRLAETSTNVHGGASPARSVALEVAGAPEPGPSDFSLRWVPPASSWGTGLGGAALEVAGSAPAALGGHWQVASVTLAADGQSCTLPGLPRDLAGGSFTTLVDASPCLAGTPGGTVVTATARVRWLYLGAFQELDVTSPAATVPLAAGTSGGSGTGTVPTGPPSTTTPTGPPSTTTPTAPPPSTTPTTLPTTTTTSPVATSTTGPPTTATMTPPPTTLTATATGG